MGDDETETRCYYESVSTNGLGLFLTDALSGLSDGEDLYVVYYDEPMTFNPAANTSAPGGYLYVADLHGSGFAEGSVNVQVKGVDGNGDQVLFGYPQYLSVNLEATEDVHDALAGATGRMDNVPYSPYVKADYPSTMWNAVDDVVALVVVGGVSASSANEWMSDVVWALADSHAENKIPEDTLAALESPDEILNEIWANSSETINYVRYVSTGKDGELDLTNLFAALEMAKKAEYRFEYPIFVGFLPKTKAINYHVTLKDTRQTDMKIQFLMKSITLSEWIDGKLKI